MLMLFSFDILLFKLASANQILNIKEKKLK